MFNLERAVSNPYQNYTLLFSKGSNLVCGPEHDYDINWKLAMFNTTDSRICPRKAQGILPITIGFCNNTKLKHQLT